MAAYVKISYNVTSSTNPTYVARYERMAELVEDWIDHVTIGSSGGTVITIEPWAPEGTSVEYYAYTFPTTGVQDLYFFSKTNEIPNYAFIGVDSDYSGDYAGHILSIDCSQSNNDITGIGESTFSINRSMQSAYLSDNITRIGRNAFEQDSAMTVCNIPESLSVIPASMFQLCSSLEHIRIPDSVQSIRASAFAGCTSLQDVYIGSGLTALNNYCFGDCSSLISITATSKNVPITYYTNTFKNVHTGGTLYYPAGYESEYGPESGMLGTQQYLLGYYDWNGIPTGTTFVRLSADTVYLTSEARPYGNPAKFYIIADNCELVTGRTNYRISGETTPREFILQILAISKESEGIYNTRYYCTENSGSTSREAWISFEVEDTSGNTYQLTQHVVQSAGSSPEPESGYVLTSLTISDNEQHRYFAEARPGVVYSAAGQYYKTISACEARYSLYYINSYGGVDVLPFKGKSFKKTDNITRLNYSRSFRNNTLEFENTNYLSEIKPTWELHTGYLVDSQSKKMHELVESTCVYLYDAEEQTYTPVVMTDKKLEYKTFYNQGRRFYTYTINVEESQSLERR